MKHFMKLQQEPFDNIKNGTKIIEMRLFDDKRKLININDEIIFSLFENFNQILLTKVKNLYKFNNFEQLYSAFDKHDLGYKQDENANPNDMKKYYSKEEQNKFGVIAIEVELIK